MTDNPQVENGYVRIATELHREICRLRIPGEARQVFDAIIHKTYGFNKKVDKISLSQLEGLTGLSSNHVCRAIKVLLSMNLITKEGSGGLNVLGVNKHYAS